MENNKKKTDISFIIITMFLLIVLIGSSIFGIITFARYRTRALGDTEARIAKWSFKVNGEEEFFSTINLADTIDFAEVEKGKIAPGTNGSFNLIIDGSGSEVSLDYYINLDIIHKPHNMKFYSDSTHTTELPITEDDKILLEDEILLPNINTPITQIIYWDWSYRTDEMPSEAVLTEYGLNKAEIDAQIAAASTQEERENIIKLTNDKIDTQDEGGEVLISASIKGVQKNPLGFVQKGIYITSDTNKEYSIGEEVTFVAEFTEGVYGDNGEQLTEETAPVLELWFDVNDNEETANLNNNLIAKVSSLENANLNLAEENIQSRIAEFVCVDRNKIMYSYTIDVGDAGRLKVLSYTGMVYNKKNSSIEVQTQELKGVKVFDNADGILEVYAPFDSTVLKDNIQNEAFSVNGNVTYNTSNKKAGSGSAHFSGEEGQCLRLNRDGLNFGTSDFTIDFWLYAEQQTSNYPTIISDNANSSLQFQIDNIKLSNTVSNTLISTEKAYKVNEWVFYRIIRKDGIFYLYENGKMVGSTDGYKSTSINLSSLAIGGNSANSTAFIGYIDELKIYNIALQGDLTTTTRNEYIAINESYTYGINNTTESIAFWGRRFTNSDFVWTSTNNDVASVNRNGKVTGLSIGSSTIIGKNEEYGINVLGIVNVHSNRTGAITVPQVFVCGETKYNEARNTYVLKEDGTVWSMGSNNYGQLGDGTNISTSTPVQVKINENMYLTDIIKISGGNNFVTAIRKDGTLWSWGFNYEGQLGNGTTANKNYATQVIGLNKKIIDIDSGFHEQSALDEDGNVYVWGRGILGVLGNGSTSDSTVPQKANINNVIKISLKEHELALTTTGEVYGWGGNGIGPNALILSSNYTLPQKMTDNAIDIIAIEKDSLILKLDENGNKKLYGCGYNQGDELQVGNTNSVAYLKEIVNLPQSVINGNAEIKYISGGQGNIQLVLSDGTVWMNGKNNYGVLANGTTTNSANFVQMQDENGVINNVLMPGYETSWAADGTYSLNSGVIKNDGTVWICGDNSSGQFGKGTTTSSNVLVQLGNKEIKLNVRNEYIKTNENLNIQILKGGLFNWFVEGSTINKNDWDWISTNEDVASVSDGIVLGKSIGHTTIICYNERLNIKGMAIVNVYSNRTGAITVPQILVGSETIYYDARNTFILKEDGTVWSMGNNNYGQLGDGTNNSSDIPVQVKIDENTYLTDIIKISGGDTSVEALRKDGTVWTWGNNDNGQLGNGTNTNRSYATQVINLNKKIIDISSGFLEQSALDEDGNVYVWGRGTLGVLGNGSTSNSTVPQKANINNVIKISQKEHELALTTAGEVYGWGGKGIGSNALILSSNYTLPQKMTDNAIDIIAIEKDSLILKLDENGNKKLYGCGYNQGDELQVGNTNSVAYLKEIVNLPQSVINGNAEIKYISGGQGNIQLVLSDGTVWMNGKNNYGVLANGTTTNSANFVQMQDENGVINNVLMPGYEVSWIDNGVYSINSGVIKRDGTVWICGDNTYGQFGNETNTSANYMKQVGNLFLRINARNEYIQAGQTYDINVIDCSIFNSFINTQEINQNEWTWESSNTDVATVNSSTGVVTGVSMGYTTITGRNSTKNLKVKAIINVYRNVEGAITYPQIGEGEGFTVVLKEDGTVWTAGKNNTYQLGDGTTTNRNTFDQVKIDENTYLTNVRKISVAQSSTIALTADGKVYGWGANDYGAFGIGNSTAQSYAVKVKGINGQGELSNIIDLSTSWWNSYFIDNDGAVLGVGNDGCGQITSAGGKRNTISKMSDFKNAIKCEAGYQTIAIMKSNSEVWIKGENNHGCFGNGVIVSAGGSYLIGDDINDISLVGLDGLIVKEDKTIYVSGYNEYGQLGNGNTSDRSAYEKLTLQDGTEVKAKYAKTSNSNNAIVELSGKIYAVGYNGCGQISGSVSGNVYYPICIKDINGSDIQNVYMVNIGSCAWNTTLTNIEAIKTDGTIWMSGDNTSGQFGDGTNTGANYMKQVGINFNVFTQNTVAMIMMLNNVIDNIF